MTDYQTHEDDQIGREANRIAERIGNAPVEPWLKVEALSDLNVLVAVARIAINDPRTEGRFESTPLKYAEEDAPVDAKDAPVDYSWQRFQIIEALSRSSVPRSTQQLLEDAKSLAEWVRNG